MNEPRNHGLETNRFGTSDKKSFITQDEIASLPEVVLPNIKMKVTEIVLLITQGMTNNFVTCGVNVLRIE